MAKSTKPNYILCCSQVDDVELSRNSLSADKVFVFSNNERKRTCRNVRSCSTNSEARPVNSDRAEAITRAMCKMIAVDMLPTSMVENQGFLDFVTTLEPGYTVPRRRVVDSRIRAIYSDVSEAIKQKLETASAVGFSTDAWTSRAVDSYITMTAHYIDQNWILQTVCLSTVKVVERHTAEHLSASVHEEINKWAVTDKISGVVHDNASNIVKTMQDLYVTEGIMSIRCAAHTLQLSINKGLHLEECSTIVQKAADIVSAFNHSYTRMHILEEKLQALSLPTLKLIQRCPTRWNSTFNMLERLHILRSGITAALSDRSIFKSSIAAKLEMCEDEWLKISDLVTVLHPLQQATTVLCADKTITLSLVRPIIHSVINRHLAIKDTDSTMILSFKLCVAVDLTDRFHMKDPGDDSEYIVKPEQMASFLDPRYKNLNAEPSDYIRECIRREVRKRIELNSNIDNDDRSHKEVRTTVLDFLLGSTVNNGEDEFSKYLSEPQIDHNLNPSAWWQAHEASFPAISKTAKQILCIPASSASSERVFSSAGNIVSAKRNCLSPHNVCMLVFLYQNRNFLLEK